MKVVFQTSIRHALFESLCFGNYKELFSFGKLVFFQTRECFGKSIKIFFSNAKN